jgi:DNA-binding winged helix-turn-helix (wHTH) protein
VTIGRLRRRLGDPPVITTTPGVGYRIPDRIEPATPPQLTSGHGHRAQRPLTPTGSAVN